MYRGYGAIGVMTSGSFSRAHDSGTAGVRIRPRAVAPGINHEPRTKRQHRNLIELTRGKRGRFLDERRERMRPVHHVVSDVRLNEMLQRLRVGDDGLS
jgi:hypothetical protein